MAGKKSWTTARKVRKREADEEDTGAENVGEPRKEIKVKSSWSSERDETAREIKRNCHRPGGCNHPCNRAPFSRAFLDPALQPLSFVFTFARRRSWKSFACRKRYSPLLVLRDFVLELRDNVGPLVEKSSNAVAISGIPSLFFLRSKKNAQSWQKISKSLDKGVPSSPAASSVEVAMSGHAFSEARNARENFQRCFLYLSVLNLRGKFSDEILFNCKINQGSRPGLTQLGYWLCENVW